MLHGVLATIMVRQFLSIFFFCDNEKINLTLKEKEEEEDCVAVKDPAKVESIYDIEVWNIWEQEK